MATRPKEDYPAEESEDQSQENRLLEAARPIIGRLSRLADEQVRAKSMIEVRWLDDLRNYFGKYDGVTLAGLKNAKRSEAFVKLTRHKTDSWAARLGDLLFPTDDKNWGIQPTPLPKLVEAAKEAIAQAEAATEAANASQDPTQQARIKEVADSFAQAARLKRKESDEAKKRCAAMEKAIEDQLIQSQYAAQCRDVIEDGCRLGTGILKGPMTSNRLRQEWRPEHGTWALVQIPDPQPEFRRVDPWHFFPDMSAAKAAEMEFTFERHLPTKKDLKRLALKMGFNKDAVRRLIREGPRPLGIEVDHLSSLRALTGEGDAVADRYVMWEYHGSLECEEIADLLRAVGKEEKAREFEEEKDPLEDYRVILHFCNDEVLKIAPEYPMDSGEGLYSIWNFSKGETSVFGVGVPNIMGDSQRSVNSAWRMMMDNAALSVGPQILINKTAITAQDNDWSLKPLKIWLMSSTAGASPNVPPFQAFNVPINTEALGNIIALGLQFIDQETGMPQVAQGEQGDASKTLGGMSMLQNAANVVFRRIVKSWDDDLTAPTIHRAYDWNMQFNPDDSIKGDMQVDARGTSVLLVREIQSQSLMQIMTNWTTHPSIGPWIKVREGLEKTLQTMMIQPDDLLRTQDDFDELMMQQAAQQEEQPADPNVIRLQVAEMEAASAERIQQMRTDVEIAKLQAATGLSEQEIRSKYGIEEMKIGSSERMKAAEIAIEARRAREARAEGKSVTAAVGQGVG